MKNMPPPGGPSGAPPGGPPGAISPVNTQLERRIKTIETKLNKLMAHLGVK